MDPADPGDLIRMALRFSSHHGIGLQRYLHELACLRIRIFCDWPYLYAGDADYESEYLQVYLRSERSIAMLVHDGDVLIGASTGLPLVEESAAFQTPFVNAGREISGIFYFGESVLAPEYRGRGIGHAFFDAREQHAENCGFSTCCFAAVRRADNDPRRPALARDLTKFWRARNYLPNGLSMQLPWRELGQEQDSLNRLDFWERALGR